MRHLFVFLLLSTTITFAQKPKKMQIVNPALWKKREMTNCKTGTQRAQADFNKGIYILQTLGQVVDKDFHPFFIKTAKEKYGITLTASPCVIFSEPKCYYQIMREKVLAKFGNDIEDKIRTEALPAFKQSEQFKKNIQPKIDTGFVFTGVPIKAKFPGDQTEMRNFIKTNIQEITNCSYWSANISFIVEKDGSLSDITFHKELKDDIRNEVARIVRLMPKWIPAHYYGEKVRFRQNITISSKKEMEMMDEIRAKKYNPTN